MKKILENHILIIALAIVASIAGCNKKSSKQAAQQKAAKVDVQPVRVAPVTQSEIPYQLVLVGNVLAHRSALITSKAPGLVKKIYHRDGERVKKNDKLVTIDPEDFDRGVQRAQAALATAYSALSQARVQRETLEKDRERMRELYDREAISLERLEKIEAGYKAANSSVNMAYSGVKQAKLALSGARSYKRDSVIRAPFDGEIAKLLLEEGERINTMPPTPVMILMDYDAVEVECQVSEREAGVIEEGQPATVRLDAFPGSEIKASVTRVVPILDPASRSFTVKIALPNEDHRIKPGMMAKAFINITYPDVITVHRDAISLNNVTGERRVVEVIDATAYERMVQTGRSFGERVEVIDLAGLKVGGMVVVSGASAIFDGQKVKVVQTEEAAPPPGEAP